MLSLFYAKKNLARKKKPQSFEAIELQFNLLKLDDYILSHIFSFLTTAHLANMAKTGKVLNESTKKHRLLGFQLTNQAQLIIYKKFLATVLGYLSVPEMAGLACVSSSFNQALSEVKINPADLRRYAYAWNVAYPHNNSNPFLDKNNMNEALACWGIVSLAEQACSDLKYPVLLERLERTINEEFIFPVDIWDLNWGWEKDKEPHTVNKLVVILMTVPDFSISLAASLATMKLLPINQYLSIPIYLSARYVIPYCIARYTSRKPKTHVLFPIYSLLEAMARACCLDNRTEERLELESRQM